MTDASRAWRFAAVFLAMILIPASLLAAAGSLQWQLKSPASGGEQYRFGWGSRAFIDQSYTWRRLPSELRGSTAWRDSFDSLQEITITVSESGWLYAALWRWDFGFLEQLPAELQLQWAGWRRVSGAACRLGGVPEPFRTLPVYRCFIPPGQTAIDIDAYIGKWIPIAFLAGSGEGESRPILHGTDFGIEGTATAHNVCRPGAAIHVTSPWSGPRVTVFRDRSVVMSPSRASFDAPMAPGRYCVAVENGEEVRVLPLTVGFDPPASSGWERGFFPILFYQGWGYLGEFRPRKAALQELEALSMMDLGANTFYGRDKPDFADQLDARKLLTIRSETRTLVRDVKDEQSALMRFTGLLASLAPLSPTTLGLYVEDEPKPEYAKRLGAFEAIATRILPGLDLIYTVHGPNAVDIWKTADSAVRMVRSYPIRKRLGDRLPDQIRRELSEYLLSSQKVGQGTPLWLVAQSFGDHGRPNLWDVPTAAQMRLMISVALARGVKGITYFCYDSSREGRELLEGIVSWPFIAENGLYQEIKNINAAISEHRGLLYGQTWMESLDSGVDRLDTQLLQQPDGRRIVWVTNLDYENRVERDILLPPMAGTLNLDLPPGGGAAYDADTGVCLMKL